MAYATHSDVSAEFKGITFSASTAITSTEVTEMISQEEATLDARLSKRYVTPITGTEALKIMKRLSIQMTKSRIVDILQVKTGDAKVDQGSSGFPIREQVEALLKMIIAGEMDLTDATLREASQGVSSYNSENIVHPTPTPSTYRTFTRDSDAW